VTTLDPDDPILEAERAAAEWVAWKFRQDEIRAAAEALCDAVWPQLLSCATANFVGQHGDGEDAGQRAYDVLNTVDDVEVLRQAVVQGMWAYAECVAKLDLEELRDFHYVDSDNGLIPVPPHGRHRAEED
jgi:hypothetical protein